jgi:hypothetical protein
VRALGAWRETLASFVASIPLVSSSARQTFGRSSSQVTMDRQSLPRHPKHFENGPIRLTLQHCSAAGRSKSNWENRADLRNSTNNMTNTNIGVIKRAGARFAFHHLGSAFHHLAIECWGHTFRMRCRAMGKCEARGTSSTPSGLFQDAVSRVRPPQATASLEDRGRSPPGTGPPPEKV